MTTLPPMSANEANAAAVTPTPADVDALRVLADADPAAELARKLAEARESVTLEILAAPMATL